MAMRNKYKITTLPPEIMLLRNGPIEETLINTILIRK